MEFSVGVGVLEVRAQDDGSPPDGAVVAIAAFEKADAVRVACVSRQRARGLAAPGPARSWHARRRKDDLVFVAGARGFACHGPCARFGESWRTNRRKPALQQGQTRGRTGFCGSAAGPATSGLVWARRGVA